MPTWYGQLWACSILPGICPRRATGCPNFLCNAEKLVKVNKNKTRRDVIGVPYFLSNAEKWVKKKVEVKNEKWKLELLLSILVSSQQLWNYWNLEDKKQNISDKMLWVSHFICNNKKVQKRIKKQKVKETFLLWN